MKCCVLLTVLFGLVLEARSFTEQTRCPLRTGACLCQGFLQEGRGQARGPGHGKGSCFEQQGCLGGGSRGSSGQVPE